MERKKIRVEKEGEKKTQPWKKPSHHFLSKNEMTGYSPMHIYSDMVLHNFQRLFAYQLVAALDDLLEVL